MFAVVAFCLKMLKSWQDATSGKHILIPCLHPVTGGMIGGFFATNVGATRPLGIEGWRFAFHLMAAVAFATVYLVLRWAVDPRPPARAVLSPLQLGSNTK